MRRIVGLVVVLVVLLAGLFGVLHVAGIDLDEIVQQVKDTAEEIAGRAGELAPHASDSGTQNGSGTQTPSPTTPPATPEDSQRRFEVYDTSPVGLRVRATPRVEDGNILGKVFDGTLLDVTGDPETGSGYEWRRVNLEGWSAADWLSGPTSVGATVTVKETGDLGLRIREQPIIGDNLLGKLYDGTRLLVTGGPAAGSGYQWWKIQLAGWCASSYLREPVPQLMPGGASETRDKELSAVKVQGRIDRLDKFLRSEIGRVSLPSDGFLLQRLLTPEIIDRSDQFYFLSMDYDYLAVRTAGFAQRWLKQGDTTMASEYVDRAWLFVRLSNNWESAAIDQLMASIDISQDMVVILAGKTAIGVAAGSAFGPAGLLASDLFEVYVDVSVDTAVRGVSTERAVRRELTELVVKQVFRLPVVKEALGEPVTQWIGNRSGLYQRLEQTMLTPEVRQEIMRVVATSAESLLIQAAGFDATWLTERILDALEETISK